MATWYTNSAAAGTGAGTSWVNATTTFAAAVALSAAGDDFNILSTSAETSASAITETLKGTAASPNRIFSCDNTNSPAQSSDLTAGASISTTGSSAPISISGFAYLYGVNFNTGAGATTSSINIANSVSGHLVFDTCQFNSLGTSATFVISIGTGTGGQGSFYEFKGCTFKTSNVANGIACISGTFRFQNCTFWATGTVPTNSFIGTVATQHPAIITVEACDLSNAGTGKTLVSAIGAGQYYTFLECKLNASVTVAATPTTPDGGVDLINCDSGATNYRNERYRYQGTLTTDTTDIRAGGASDGTTPISHKVVATANANWQSPFECFDIVQWWGTGLGSSHTVSIPMLSNATLTNADVWPEVEFLGSGLSPLGTVNSGGLTNPLAANNGGWAIDGTSSWTTTGVSGPVQQTLSVAFTPQQAGYVRVRIRVAKASQTLRIDPLLQIV